MIRKFRLQITPTDATEAVLQLHKASRKHWPEAWGDLQLRSAEIAEPLIQESRELRELLSDVGSSFWIDLEEEFEHPCQLAVQLKFPCLAISMDLKDVLEDERSIDALFALAILLARLRKSMAYNINLKMGGRRYTVEEGLTRLIEQASEFGITFSAAEEDAEGAGEDEEETKEESTEEPKEATGRKTGSKKNRKSKKKTDPYTKKDEENEKSDDADAFFGEDGVNGGFFGGLDEDAPPSESEGDAEESFSFGEAEWEMDVALLPEAAQYYLQVLELEWPCTLAVLQRSYKKAVRLAHPDRHLNDPKAHQRFVMIQQGFEILRKQL
jgi:hypothetical protein